jgi:hypothetical protein
MARPTLGGISFTALTLALSCASHLARAADYAEALLRQSIETRTTATSGGGSEKVSAIYLDTVGPCAFAALVRSHGEIENFTLCGNTLSKRNVSPPPWPDTPGSREFRERVIYLALLYRTSSGIDPNGYKIRARLTDAGADACKIAEVATMADSALVRLDLLPACPH